MEHVANNSFSMRLDINKDALLNVKEVGALTEQKIRLGSTLQGRIQDFW